MFHFVINKVKSYLIKKKEKEILNHKCSADKNKWYFRRL